MSLKLYFCIVAKGDIPIFESSFGVTLPLESQKNDLVQFVVHASLDIVEQRAATTTSMFLKSVDKFNDMTISAFVTGAGVKLLLLHDERFREQDVKAFFDEAYEGYVKTTMSPFYEPNSVFTSQAYQEKLIESARRLVVRST